MLLLRAKKSIDFVMPPWLFQCTLKRTHQVLASGITNISCQFKLTEWKLCFCVPDANFDNFRKQTIVGELDDVHVSQYKVAV